MEKMNAFEMSSTAKTQEENLDLAAIELEIERI